ncbi:MAG: cell division protein ZapA [Clostridia bacterium]|nr:MAG: cell division protein ZapA [Clostridia bacterium]
MIGLATAETSLTRLTVSIYGQEYTIRGDEPPEYIRDVVSLVDKKMRQIGQKSPGLPITKVAVLAALHMADELCKLREDYAALVKLIEEGKKAK